MSSSLFSRREAGAVVENATLCFSLLVLIVVIVEDASFSLMALFPFSVELCVIDEAVVGFEVAVTVDAGNATREGDFSVDDVIFDEGGVIIASFSIPRLIVVFVIYSGTNSSMAVSFDRMRPSLFTGLSSIIDDANVVFIL